MATTAQDNVVYEQKRMWFPVLQDGTSDINQGDQVYMDTTAKVIKSLGASDDSNANTYVGIAMASSFIQPYSQKKYQPLIPVLIAGVVNQNTTSGDTYNEGDALYVGADAQTVARRKDGATSSTSRPLAATRSRTTSTQATPRYSKGCRTITGSGTGRSLAGKPSGLTSSSRSFPCAATLPRRPPESAYHQ